MHVMYFRVYRHVTSRASLKRCLFAQLVLVIVCLDNVELSTRQHKERLALNCDKPASRVPQHFLFPCFWRAPQRCVHIEAPPRQRNLVAKY